MWSTPGLYSPASGYSCTTPARRGASPGALAREDDRIRQLRHDSTALASLKQTHEERLHELHKLSRLPLVLEPSVAVEATRADTTEFLVERRALEEALRLAEQSLTGEKCALRLLSSTLCL
eukprot:scaffold199534_cov18-Tisochrysis_lutea.AAC.1